MLGTQPPAPIGVCAWTGCGQIVYEGEEAIMGGMRMSNYHARHFPRPRRTPDGKAREFRTPQGGRIRVRNAKRIVRPAWESPESWEKKQAERRDRKKAQKKPSPPIPDPGPPRVSVEPEVILTRRQRLLQKFGIPSGR